MDNQLDIRFSSPPIFTSESILDLVGKVACVVKKATRHRRRDRFFFLRHMPRELLRELRESRIWERPIGFERCPGLSCRLRMFAMAPKPSLLLDFIQFQPCTEQDLRNALLKSSPARMKALNSPIKKLTVEIGLSGIAGSRRSQWQKSFRLSDRRRFSGKRTPTRILVDPQLRANEIRLDSKESIIRVGRPVSNELATVLAEGRSPRPRRTIYADSKQSVDEIRLHLLLYLRQEGMINDVDDALRELVRKCFKIGDDGDNFLVLDALLKNFTLPEDWRAMKGYIWRLTRGLRSQTVRSVKAVGFDPDEAQKMKEQNARGRISRRAEIGEVGDGTSLYSIRKAVTLLTAEGYSVSPDRLYDWINRGKIKHQRQKYMRCLDEDSLGEVRKALGRQRLVTFLIEARGMKKDTARKYLRRHLEKGESLEEMVKRITTSS